MLYTNATSTLSTNGNKSKPISIKSSVRQRCPLSMTLFVLCIDPLLNALDKILTGVRVGGRETKTTIIAYADDVTIAVTKPKEIPIIHDTLRTYQKATGATINVQKSKVIALGSWNKSITIMDISYYTEMKVLGLHVQNEIRAAATKTWNVLTNKVKAQAHDMYQRESDLEKRIRYVQEYLLTRVWYIAQILPPPKENLRQINMTISWFLWKGEIFRVPLSTLQRTKKDGGWGMVHTAAKCMALLFYRMNEQGRKNGTMTVGWMR